MQQAAYVFVIPNVVDIRTVVFMRNVMIGYDFLLIFSLYQPLRHVELEV